MKIKVYVIDLEMPRWAKRALVVGGAFAAVLVGATALVHADTVSVPNTFTDGETLSADKMNANFNALRDAINNANPDCPRGYDKVGPAATFLPASIVCKKGDDEVVKVGTGASAFWIDRYEASVWTAASGGTQIADNDKPRTRQPCGQRSGRHAAVRAQRGGRDAQPDDDVVPGSALLPRERQAAADRRGVADRGLGHVRSRGATMERSTPGATRHRQPPHPARRAWPCWQRHRQDRRVHQRLGAEDMIGNLWEWTAEWYAAPSASTSPPSATPWPSAGSYGDDSTRGISSYAHDGYTGFVRGLPAAAVRGESWGGGLGSGVFSLSLGDAPSHWAGSVGLRCVVPSS
jgi:hypothetical protein